MFKLEFSLIIFIFLSISSNEDKVELLQLYHPDWCLLGQITITPSLLYIKFLLNSTLYSFINFSALPGIKGISNVFFKDNVPKYNLLNAVLLFNLNLSNTIY